MGKERSHTETIGDIIQGQRSRGEIAENLLISGATDEHTRRLILEVLLDIRDLLREITNK